MRTVLLNEWTTAYVISPKTTVYLHTDKGAAWSEKCALEWSNQVNGFQQPPMVVGGTFRRTLGRILGWFVTS